MKELLDSADIVADPPVLRERLAAEGYLFFRGLLPATVIDGVRGQIARILADSEWLAAGSQPDELLASDRAVEEGSAEFFGVYTAIQSTEAFHAVAVRPELLGLAERLLGEEAFAHPAHT